ncbi:hypothetical protein PIB30_017750 [Stylosanthes scabra]|uniref:RNase H type-1 domain-containing protein n=1 Tax=Stylosanthes scabra TaxID=79078 RepID=A0ABU6T8G2_9FABA|nr:hypothetical protein [Stylosanthes scabra]
MDFFGILKIWVNHFDSALLFISQIRILPSIIFGKIDLGVLKIFILHWLMILNNVSLLLIQLSLWGNDGLVLASLVFQVIHLQGWVSLVGKEICELAEGMQLAVALEITDSFGDWVIGSAGTIMETSILRCELFAVWRDLLLTWENGHREVICETDNIDVFRFAQWPCRAVGANSMDLISKIQDILSRNWTVHVNLIQRSANQVADFMAKEAAVKRLPHAEWLQARNFILPCLVKDLTQPS